MRHLKKFLSLSILLLNSCASKEPLVQPPIDIGVISYRGGSYQCMFSDKDGNLYSIPINECGQKYRVLSSDNFLNLSIFLLEVQQRLHACED